MAHFREELSAKLSNSRLNQCLERPGAFWAVAVALLAVMAAMMLFSALGDTCTNDESTHLTNGYAYWKTGAMWYDQINPALSRLLSALPLLALDARFPAEHPSWREFHQYLTLQHLFLYRNRVPPDTLVFHGRLVPMLFTLIIGFVLCWWVRRQFGATAGLAALALYAFEPAILGYGRYATTETFTVGFQFFAIIAWGWYVMSKRWWILLPAGVLTGLALASKHSSVFLFGLLPLLFVIRWWQRPREYSAVRLIASMVVIAVLAAATVGAVYWPVTYPMLKYGPRLAAGEVTPDTPAGHLFVTLAERLRLPYHPYLMGFYWLATMNSKGTPSYLLGETYQLGKLHFFPVAFLVKSSTALLLGLLACAGILVRNARGRPWLRALRELDYRWLLVTVPPVFYFVLCLKSDLNSGIRHLLPIFPFLFAFAAAFLVRYAPRWLPAAVLALLVAESALIYPHYLEFFNWPSGGAANGHRYLVNANLDWGQNLRRLKRYLDEHGIGEVYMAYHGRCEPEYYGIRWQPLRPDLTPEEQRDFDGVAVISASYLKDLYIFDGSFRWLDEMEPSGRVGYSIFVYDLRKDRAGGGRAPE